MRIDRMTLAVGIAALVMAANIGQGEEKAADTPKPDCPCVPAQAAPAAKSETPEKKVSPNALVVYCSGQLAGPVGAVIEAFTTETHIEVAPTFGNTGKLLGQLQKTKDVDVFIPGDNDFAIQAKEKKLIVGEPRPVCYFAPAIYVRKGNPKNIRELSDLTRPGMQLALADASSPVGHVQVQLFQANGLDEAALKKNTIVVPEGIGPVLKLVALGSVDAGIVWESFGDYEPDKAEIVRIPAKKNVVSMSSLVVLAGAKHAKAAEAFADFLTSKKGKAILKANGVTVEKP